MKYRLITAILCGVVCFTWTFPEAFFGELPIMSSVPMDHKRYVRHLKKQFQSKPKEISVDVFINQLKKKFNDVKSHFPFNNRVVANKIMTKLQNMKRSKSMKTHKSKKGKGKKVKHVNKTKHRKTKKNKNLTRSEVESRFRSIL